MCHASLSPLVPIGPGAGWEPGGGGGTGKPARSSGANDRSRTMGEKNMQKQPLMHVIML